MLRPAVANIRLVIEFESNKIGALLQGVIPPSEVHRQRIYLGLMGLILGLGRPRLIYITIVRVSCIHGGKRIKQARTDFTGEYSPA
jgi:hypothetical protein